MSAKKAKNVKNAKTLKLEQQFFQRELQDVMKFRKVMVWDTIVLTVVLLSTLYMTFKSWQVFYARTTDVKQILNKQKKELMVSSSFNLFASILFVRYILFNHGFGSPVRFDLFAVSFNFVFSFTVFMWSISLNTGKIEWCVNKAVQNINIILFLYMIQVLIIIFFIVKQWHYITREIKYITKQINNMKK